MDAEVKTPDVLQGDTYRFYIPIEENDLVKSVDVDENGDYIVQGVMTSDDHDEEGDSISPEGMDCSYFLQNGWIKYEHGNRPEQFIGEPIEVKVGQFKHPKKDKYVNGILVKGRLFAHRELARQAVRTILDLQKSNTKRTMGWSIEGSVKERDRKTGKIVKSILRNVVLTMNPVNTMTWAELAKSFAKNHELTIDMPDISKAMDTEDMAPLRRQSIDGYNPEDEEKDPQQKWIDMFRAFVKSALMKKSFISSSPDFIETSAFYEAVDRGLDYEEAKAFASYIAEKIPILKSIQKYLGGGGMGAEKVKNTLSALLDSDLEELEKSLAMAEEDEELFEGEELEKAMNEDLEDDEDNNADEETEDEGYEDEGYDEDEGDDEDEDDEEDVQKSFGSSELRKSMSKNGHRQAFEVSEFLKDLTDEIGFMMEGLEKSLQNVTKQQNTTLGVLKNFGEALQKSFEVIEDLKADNEELRKSIDMLMGRPVGRKSVVNQREIQTLTKSHNAGPSAPITRADVTDILVKSFEAGEIPGSVVTKFESGMPLESLNLPDKVKAKLNLI